MKSKIIALICALLFNVIGAGAIAAASGLPFAAIFGGGAVLSAFAATPTGSLNMGLQVEIWHNSIVGNLFANNSFLSKAFNADDYVNGKLVHIPNAGRPSRTEKNRTNVPAQAKKRDDKDVEYIMSEFTTDPIYIPNAETVELSYNKRESAIAEDRAVLHEVVANDILLQWSPKTSANIIRTSGNATPVYLNGATGFRKALTKADVAKAMTLLNEQNVPLEGRYALVDAQQHAQLLNSLTEHEALAFHAAADIANGVIGKLLSFNFMMRSKALIYKADGTPLEWESPDEDNPQTFSATDNAGALFWHERHVCRSLGLVKMFGKEDDPTYYGDVYSFLLRAGGSIMRKNGRGVVAIVQDTAEENYVAPATFSTRGIDVNTGQPITQQTLELLVDAISRLSETNEAQQNYLAELKAELDEKKDNSNVNEEVTPINENNPKLTKSAIRKLTKSALEAFISDNKLNVEITEGMTNAQLADAIIEALGEAYFTETVTE